jgi:hypothetical protein
MPTTSPEPIDAGTTDRGERMRASRAVMRYLDSLTSDAPTTPARSSRTVEAELAKLDQRLAQPGLSSAKRLKLLQDHRDLQTNGLPTRGQRSEDGPQDGFITHAAAYARIHHISYEAFLDFGVAPEVLDKADIRPTEDPDGEPETAHKATEATEATEATTF